MEIDRLRYMVASYLRTRLRKVRFICQLGRAQAPSSKRLSLTNVDVFIHQIEKFALHLLGDAVLMQRLSQKELSFAKQYVVLFETHVNDLALGKFAEEHRSITTEGMGTYDLYIFL